MNVTNDHLDTAVETFDHPVLQITVDRPERRLMLVLLAQLDAIDEDLQAVIDEHHVETASDAVLERMGTLTYTSRRDGESDDYYRYRLIAEGGIKRIQPVFEELAPFTKLLLDAEYSEFSVTTDLDTNPATFEVTAPTATWDGSPLDRSDLDYYLGEAQPSGHSFNRVET